MVAEGARDRNGNPITADQVKQVLHDRLGEDTRVTILGHVQRGGAPSAFDRWHSTILGADAVDEVLTATTESEPKLIGLRQNRAIRSPLMPAVAQTKLVAKVIADKDYEQAMALRGGSFAESFRIFKTLTRAKPHAPDPQQRQLRLAVLHAGGPAPGMNTAVRVAVRLGIDQGHTMLGVHNGFEGLVKGNIRELDWMSVHGWVSRGGAELGTSRLMPSAEELAAIAATLTSYHIDGLLMIGGWAGYAAAAEIYRHREGTRAFRIPIVCLPASIDNNLPGSELSIGADTALNSIVTDVDKIKQSAVAARRVFVVEVMGRDCGYLALMSGLATGAEHVYLPEDGVTLADLQVDVNSLIDGFQHGKRLGLIIRNENADRVYSTAFMCALFEKEGKNWFDVRPAILGHVQQGGNPTPFDRIQATRLAARCVEFLIAEAGRPAPAASAIGVQAGKVGFTSLADLALLIDPIYQRPVEQWWMRLKPLAEMLSQPTPDEPAKQVSPSKP
jgi:6-phosphofructokinase 1